MKHAKFYYNNANAPKPNQPSHIGVSVIIKCDNKILLEQRTNSNQ